MAGSLNQARQPQAPRPAAAPSEKPRQTDFSDQNYRPKATVNIVKAVTPTPQKPEPRTKGTAVVGLKETPKGSDYCPGGEGSIIRRNCKMAYDLNSR